MHSMTATHELLLVASNPPRGVMSMLTLPHRHTRAHITATEVAVNPITQVAPIPDKSYSTSYAQNNTQNGM